MIGLSLLFALGLFYLRHSGFIDSFLFNTLGVICLLGVVVNIVKIMKSRKQDPQSSPARRWMDTRAKPSN